MITLQEGKKYITRNNIILKVEHDQITGGFYKFRAKHEGDYYYYGENGKFLSDMTESPYDIVAECIEPNKACSTEDAVIRLIRKRGKVGREKYKCSMDRKDLHPDEWIEHHQQELCDALQYAERMKGASRLLHEARDMLMTLMGERGWECAKEWIDRYHAQFLPRENKPEKQ